MKILQLCCLCFVLFLLACQSPTEQKAETNMHTASEPEVVKTAASTSNSNAGKVPIYNYEGLKHIFEQKNDTTYVINFWATWCKPCVEELPYFVDLHEKYQDKAFQLILVSLDFPKQIEKKLIPFLDKHQLPGRMMVLDDPDANTWINAVDPEWSGAIPATVVYRSDKRSFHEQSFDSFAELDEIVESYFH